MIKVNLKVHGAQDLVNYSHSGRGNSEALKLLIPILKVGFIAVGFVAARFFSMVNCF